METLKAAALVGKAVGSDDGYVWIFPPRFLPTFRRMMLEGPLRLSFAEKVGTNYLLKMDTIHP